MTSIRRPRSGRGWEARYRDPDGKQRSKTFTTKREAERFLERLGSDLQRGDWLDPQRQKIGFGQWTAEWRNTIVHLEPNTIAFYDSMLRAHVTPWFGDRPVGTIDQAVVRRFVSELVAADNGARVVQGALQTVRHILSIAHGSGAIRHNPCVGVKVPRLERRDCVFLTAPQILELADAITPPYGVLIKFAAYTGLRAGEIGGLRLRRLDLLRGQVDVVEALKDTSGRLHFGPTKNHLRRTVGLPRLLCDDLGVYLAGRNLKPDDLVFQSPTGSALRHHEFYRRYYKPAVRVAGLPDGLRFHDLRHTCAALLIAQGAHPRAIMERLGHSNITVTLNTYGHLLPGLDDALTDGLDATYRNATDQRSNLGARAGIVVALADKARRV